MWLGSQSASVKRPWLGQDLTLLEPLIHTNIGRESKLFIKEPVESYTEVLNLRIKGKKWEIVKSSASHNFKSNTCSFTLLREYRLLW